MSRCGLNDTHPDAERVQTERLRRATPEERGALTVALTGTVIAASRAAIRRAHPEFDDRGIGLEFVRVHYGRDLAERVRAHLDALA